MKRIQTLVFIIALLVTRSLPAQDLKQFQNILDIKAYPEKKSRTSGLFTDQGAWFGFCLLPDSTSITGFGGPWVISEKKWTSLSLAQFEVKIENLINPIMFKKVNQDYQPGKIEASYLSDHLSLNQYIIFGENGIAYEVATLKNTSNTPIKVSSSWVGRSWQKISEKGYNQVCLSYKDERSLSIFHNQVENVLLVDTLNKFYQFKSSKLVSLKPGEETTSWIAIGLSFTDNERNQMEKSIPKNLVDILAQVDASKNRWEGYLKSILLKQKSEYDRIAVKSVMTMISNWRKAELDLHHDGLIPSHAVTYFDGFWAWDSWKHAVGLSLFAPNLAKNQILAMFDYQDSLGMIPDCIYLDKSENNLRDTKPPLAAWAVYETFKNCHDTAFVKSILPKLIAYHDWWYKYRDINKNGWCEFGSIDGTLEAAAWESGMDNAVRFDSVKMLHAGGIAWSMDQESVDLNAFLTIEKYYLSELLTVTGKSKEAIKYSKDFQSLRAKFDDYFFDSKNGYYYDVSIKDGKKIEVDGTEAFIPLWAKLATKEHALGVKNVITNPSKFNTFMPFPTLSADHPKFDANGYWRGPVWMDQAWFGVTGLNNYQFINETKDLTLKLFNNANGLLGDKPIHENYNPITGERIKAPHFSWSAIHFLLLYRNGFHLNP